jgi:hypothetical protein
MRNLTLEIYLLGQMTLLSLVLGAALIRDTPLTLEVQHIAKGGLKGLALGWLAQVMTHSSSLRSSMGQGNAHFACEFFFPFSPHILQTIFTENFIKITVPSKCIHMLNLQHQALFALICSTAMHRSGLRHVKSRTLPWGVRRGKRP